MQNQIQNDFKLPSFPKRGKFFRKGEEIIMSNSNRERIKRGIKRMQKAEPYSKSEFEAILNSMPDEIFPYLMGEMDNLPECTVEYDDDRFSATMAKHALDRYFAEHPQESIEDYIS